MINLIKCFKPEQELYSYNRNNYYNFINNIFPSYFYNYRSIVIWEFDSNEFSYSNNLMKHIPLKDWNGIAFISEDYENIIVCNPDATVRFKIETPNELIQWENYIDHFKNDNLNKDQYKIRFSRFDDYYEFNGKYYLQILISMENINNSSDAYTQMRYLDPEKGTFLPFTKQISRLTPNQFDYNEQVIDL